MVEIIAMAIFFILNVAACLHFARIARRETKKAVCHVEHIELLHGVMNELRSKIPKK